MHCDDTVGNHPEFDTGYGIRAHITDTHLVISSSTTDSASQKVDAEYALAGITSIRETGLPAGQSAVTVVLRGYERNPGLTFRVPHVATDFVNALLDATEEALR